MKLLQEACYSFFTKLGERKEKKKKDIRSFLGESDSECAREASSGPFVCGVQSANKAVQP
jgi:hypothetical protein